MTSFFRGTHLVGMTFNYPFCGLGSRVRVKVLGSVYSNHNHNPKHIYNPNPNPTLTIIPYMSTQREVFEGQTGNPASDHEPTSEGGPGVPPDIFKNVYCQLAGYPALLGPLPLYFSLPIRYSLGLPGFAQNICSVIIAEDNCIPGILFKT